MGLVGQTTYGGGGAQTDAWGDRPQYTAWDGGAALGNSLNNRGPFAPQPMNTGQSISGPAGSASDRLLHARQNRAEILKMQAAEQPPPMQYVTGAGVVPGWMQDPNAMNAYQRQAYLPQSSEANPQADAAGQAIRDENARKSDEAFSAMVQRRRAVDQTGGGPAYGGLVGAR
jgi:hypothetical protein